MLYGFVILRATNFCNIYEASCFSLYHNFPKFSYTIKVFCCNHSKIQTEIEQKCFMKIQNELQTVKTLNLICTVCPWVSVLKTLDHYGKLKDKLGI